MNQISQQREQALRDLAIDNFNGYSEGWLKGEYDTQMLAEQYSVNEDYTPEEIKPILDAAFQEWLDEMLDDNISQIGKPRQDREAKQKPE